MTIKEIAELCGVDQSTVWRWAQEPACKMQAALTEKLGEAGHGKSADFTKEMLSTPNGGFFLLMAKNMIGW
jgi:DNA-binding MurR/RpiR family transcriptional regulator